MSRPPFWETENQKQIRTKRETIDNYFFELRAKRKELQQLEIDRQEILTFSYSWRNHGDQTAIENKIVETKNRIRFLERALGYSVDYEIHPDHMADDRSDGGLGNGGKWTSWYPGR